jgi:hypothetical protein
MSLAPSSEEFLLHLLFNQEASSEMSSYLRAAWSYNPIHSIVPDPDSSYKTKLLGFLVRKRTIPTERPQPVGEVSANFS